jgi:hypothetical protein
MLGTARRGQLAWGPPDRLMRARMGVFTTLPPLWKFKTMNRTSHGILREKVPVVATTAAVGGYYYVLVRKPPIRTARPSCGGYINLNLSM